MLRQLENEIMFRSSLEKLLSQLPACAPKNYGRHFARDVVKYTRAEGAFDRLDFDAYTEAFRQLTKRLGISLRFQKGNKNLLKSGYVEWNWYQNLLILASKDIRINPNVFIKAHKDFFSVGEYLGQFYFKDVAQEMRTRRFNEGLDSEWMIGFVVSAIMLIGIFDLPYWYYTILRIAATIFFLGTAALCHEQEKRILMCASLGLGFLFNPLFPIYLDKESWLIWDIVASIVGLYLTYNIKRKI